MSTPTHLAHKPITSVNDYRHHDGIYKDMMVFTKIIRMQNLYL